MKDAIRKNAHKLAGMHANKNDLVCGLIEALTAAGMSLSDIGDILSDPEIDSLLSSIAAWDEANTEEKAILSDDRTASGSLIKNFLSIKNNNQSLSQWASHHTFPLLGSVCSALGRAAVAIPHPFFKNGGTALEFAGAGCFAYARAQALQRSQGQFQSATQQHLQNRSLIHFLNEQHKNGKSAPNAFTKETRDLLGKTNRIKREVLERPGKGKVETTLRAAQKELKGEQIPLAHARGRTYDHVRKVKSAQSGLDNHIQALKNRLGYPKIPTAERQVLEQELSQASKLLDHTEVFVPRS